MDTVQPQVEPEFSPALASVLADFEKSGRETHLVIGLVDNAIRLLDKAEARDNHRGWGNAGRSIDYYEGGVDTVIQALGLLDDSINPESWKSILARERTFRYTQNSE